MKTTQYEELFQGNVVLTIENLKQATGRPRESILRDLKNIGYYSSYNARGRFYTLASIPKFDVLGLWKYNDACFSIRHSLLDTAEHLINISDAGHTHDELKRLLGIVIQNSLHHLTMTDRIVRRHVGARNVYFGKVNIGDQLERRNAMFIKSAAQTGKQIRDAKVHPDIDPALVIEILVAVLRGHETDSAVCSYLHRTGSPVTEQQVATVFRFYSIGKKNSPIQK
jgi:hypothetical protein